MAFNKLNSQIFLKFMKIKQKNVNFIENIIFITLLHETSAKYFHFSLRRKKYSSHSHSEEFYVIFYDFSYIYVWCYTRACIFAYIVYDTNNSKITETKPLLPPIK